MSITEQQQTGYMAAEEADQLVNELIAKYPPSEYPYFWLTYSRTVGSSLDICYDIAKTVLHRGAERNQRATDQVLD